MNKLLNVFFAFYLAIAQAQITSNNDKIYVCFKNINQENIKNEDFIREIILSDKSLDRLILDYNINFTKGFGFTEDKLNYLANQALKISGTNQNVLKLKSIFLLETNESDIEKLNKLIRELKNSSAIEYVSILNSIPIKPPFDIAPTTPNFQPQQNYIGPNPGVNMQYAWNLGLNGQGINLRNIEYGFNKNHEEFHQINAFLAPNTTISPAITTEYSEHGTGTLGVLYAHNGGYGVTGLAYGANEVILYPEYTIQYGYNRNYAVSLAINNSNTGDVILYEMQTGGAANQEDYVPAEYNQVIWNLTKAASDAGIIIVAAAGNGNQNLDDYLYQDYMNRGNSGAIIVGAGSPNTAHNRMSFSTYGSRVDLQGWGSNVLSTGYGDAYQIGGDFNQNYTYFSGTSSATPIVASCVAVLQSYYHSLTGEYLTSEQIKQIFKETGTPQGIGVSGNIGPLPNMQTAISYINNNLSNNQLKAENNIKIYPNPAKENVYIEMEFDNETSLNIYNIAGQKVLNSTFIKSHNLNIENLTNGVYIIELKNNKVNITKKLIKH